MKGVYLKKGNTKVSVVPYYRIGDLFLTTIATNPSNFLGGKWELFGPGRCLVCVDISQDEFNEVKKTGGSKYLQSHNHSFSGTTDGAGSHSHYVNRAGFLVGNTGSEYGTAISGSHRGLGWCDTPPTNSVGNHSHSYSGNTGNSGSGDSQNLPPFITCYVWIRTA